MKKRKRMSLRKSKRLFRNTALKSHRLNFINQRFTRGGGRL
jgi:hypothetical protein